MIRSITYFVDAGIHVRGPGEELVKGAFLAISADGTGSMRLHNALPITPSMEITSHITGGHIMSAIEWLRGFDVPGEAVHWQISRGIVLAKTSLGIALCMLDGGSSVEFVMSVAKVEKQDYDDLFTATLHYRV